MPTVGPQLGTMRRSRSIRTKLIALVALPMIALAVLAALGVRWAADAAERSRDAARRAEVAVASTAAALDVARERGLSVAVLGGQATGRVANPGHVTELRFQRGQTDVALDTLDAALPGGATTDLRAELDSLRAAVDGDGDRDGDGIVSSEALDRYTATVEQLFATVATNIDAIDDPDLRDTARSYTGLTRATDAVTLQQTELMSGLVAGSLDPATRDRLVEAVAVEDLWRQQFEQGATDGQLDTYTSALQSPSVAAADRLRSEALAVGPAGLLEGGDLWFSSTSRKVDLLNGVADRVAADLTSDADAARRAADGQRNLLVGLGLVGIALILGLLVLLQRIVVRPIRRLTHAAHEVAEEVLPRAVELAHSDGAEAADQVAVCIEADTADELGELTGAFNAVQRAAVQLATEQAVLRRNVNDVFVNMGRRTQNLVTRQLEHIDQMEARTDDPERLADLFLLDHLSTRLRRNAENMLVLAGAESPRPWTRPVSILNVVRAALAESTDYSRVDVDHLQPVGVVGAAVSDISHLLAELVDNALAFSPPAARVSVTGRWTPDGGYAVAIIDAGLGMPPDRLAAANARISDPPADDFAVSRFLGLYVVGRLAERHGVSVALAHSPLGGITANVVMPASLVVRPDAGAPGLGTGARVGSSSASGPPPDRTPIPPPPAVPTPSPAYASPTMPVGRGRG